MLWGFRSTIDGRSVRPRSTRPPSPTPPVTPFQLHKFIRLAALLLVFALAPTPTSAQRKKPVLRPPSRDYFAGRILLLPLDSRPASWQLPRLVARVADHEIIAPTRSLLGGPDKPADVEGVVSWARSQNYSEVSGVIVSLDLLSFGGARAARVSPETLRQRLALLEWVRAERPQLAVYGFIADHSGVADAGEADAAAALDGLALDLAAKGTLDYLILHRPEKSSPDGAGGELQGAIRARGLSDRVAVQPAATEPAAALVARHLHRHYKRPLKVLPVYPGSPEVSRPVSAAVDAQLAVIGGTRLAGGTPDTPASVAARQADVLLFVYPAGVDDAAAQQIIDGVTRAASAGHYVAVADLSDVSDERLMKELRRLKLLDLLVAYAASHGGEGGTANDLEGAAARAVGLALAQSAARIVGAKFLRDDVDRLQRIERAQVELSFTRYLEDWGYARKVRPRLEAHVRDALKADPQNLGAAAEKAAEFARSEMATLAEGLFNEQFRRNVHSVLVVDAGRAEFMLHSLQRFQFRLPWARTDVPEVLPRIYVSLYSLPQSLINK
jgi:hypothetical protein